MAVVNLPDAPSNGTTQTVGGITYTYNSTKGYWTAAASSGGGGGGGASVTTDDSAPGSPSDGDLWYDTDDGGMFVYYEDTDSSQWVEVIGSVGSDGAAGATGADATPTSYTNLAGFPSSGNTLGDLGVAQDTKALYMWDGTTWKRISVGSDESPRVTTEPATSHSLNSDGSTSTVTMIAEDPEGFDIEYAVKYNTSGGALPSQLASATTINQSTGVFTFTPTTTVANAGDFNARLTASDGNRVTVRTVPFSLGFYPQLANVVGRYEFFNTSSYNRSTSTTALNDISGNNRHITISNPGAYSSDGFLTHTAGSTGMNFGANSDQKSWAIIFRVPSGWTRSVMWDNATADSTYYAALEDGNGGGGTPYSGYSTAWSGETVVDYSNGTNANGNRITAWSALTTGSTNSLVTTGLQMANTNMRYTAYPSYAVTNEVYAIIFWDVVLTAAEAEAVHNHYRGLLGNANMAAWST